MHIFDASSIVHAWDNYPIDVFPPLWDWIARQLANEEIKMPTPAIAEVAHVAPECADWLSNNSLARVEISDAVLQHALAFKAALGIVGDAYSSGVDENDLFIIACAKVANVTLVSNEAVQPQLPQAMPKYKIPAVCNLRVAAVPCINFVDYLRGSKQIFG